MTNSVATLSPVEFAGSTIYVVEHDGKPFVPAKYLAEAMGLTWRTQHEKLSENPERWGIREILIPSAGGLQMMVCIVLYKLAGWLNTISVNKLKDLTVRDRVIKYQNECDTALWDYWNTGHAIRPIALPATITPAQAQHLRELVQLVVETGKQGHGETWNRLHRKMKVNSYLALRPDQFDAACQYLQGKFDDTSIATLIQKHLPHAVPAIPMKNALQSLPAPQAKAMDVQTLCQLILGGIFTGRDFIDLAYAVNQHQFTLACNNPHRGYGEEVASKFKDMDWSDLHTINTRASMEVWMRSEVPRMAA